MDNGNMFVIGFTIGMVLMAVALIAASIPSKLYDARLTAARAKRRKLKKGYRWRSLS